MTLWLALWACAGDTEPEVPTEGVLSTLTYNVHGLPSELTGDDTPARMDAIAPLLAEFDLIGLQEDFDSDLHEALTSALDHESRLWFDELLPERFYGSGLASLGRLETAESWTEHYDACHGVLEGASDCLASKGFSVLRLVLGGAATVDLYNTHLEAGSGDEDLAARASHVDQVLTSLTGASAGQAVIFVGDFNLHEDRDEPDRELYDQLIEEGGLSDACQTVSCPETRIDKFLYRSGSAVALTPTSWANRTDDFQLDGEPLSDHDPLAADFAWEAVGD